MTELDNAYDATTPEAAKAKYNAWADAYETELMSGGYRLPWIMAAAVASYVPRSATPLLDAGCGGGLQVEPLHLLGYRGFTGLDLSPGMLGVARGKGLYDDLVEAALGGSLPFADDKFAATLTAGTITPGHAPPNAFEDLVRVTKKGGFLIYSMRHDAGQEPAYLEAIARYEADGLWREIFRTPVFHTIPVGAPEVMNAVHVCEVLT
ncbi:class I SAM-dependent methyltransferase [Gymnodinialimonas hymeniacidonis]|uniref:class I SAM-dependent DNA methyltransferase n=1 Tax=Gymnodinialimonas hymeniacidonis TaxID=3126508 RepID=UPI0034C6AB1D